MCGSVSLAVSGQTQTSMIVLRRADRGVHDHANGRQLASMRSNAAVGDPAQVSRYLADLEPRLTSVALTADAVMGASVRTVAARTG